MISKNLRAYVATGVLIVASGIGPTAMAQSQAAAPPERAVSSPSDLDFARKAIIANRFEIAAGKLAESNAGDAKVKAFGQMMVTDHSAALKELEAASQSSNVTSTNGARIDAAHQAKLDALAAKKGADFDAAYIADMKKGHDDTLALLKAYQQSGTSEKLKAWAAKAQPTVQKHRDAIYAM